MPAATWDLLRQLPEPVAIVSPEGETIEANQAFSDLAHSHGSGSRITDFFGAELGQLLELAARDGESRATLILNSGPEPRRWFRVTLAASKDRQTLAALLVNVTPEVELRRIDLARDRELTSLKEIGVTLSGTTDIDQIVERIYVQATRLCDTTSFYMALYDRDGQVVSFPRYIEAGQWHNLTSRPLSNGLTEYVLRTGRPLLINHDVLERARSLGIEPIGRPCESWLGVPMIADHEAMGMIAIQDFEHADRYTRHHVEVLGIIAGQASAAIKNARLLTAWRRAYEDLSEAQARLLEAERARGVTEAVGAMNHEVNNPLAVIVGNAQLLLRSDDLSPALRAKLDHMLTAARRIQEVTTKMSTLIQTATVAYPGEGAIVDLKRSVSVGDTCAVPARGAREAA